MKPVIRVENLSKQYQLGELGTGTVSHDLNRWWHKVRGKPDPYLKIGETNDRSQKGQSDLVWALKDINFEVQQGEVLGIIGKNGAGKSTLLKILSRITGPTTGRVQVKGRIASLLEVGTGFHPELTGRENIYLNGTILGMRKREVDRKLDEIVDFAGVARYLDTPVKRYSSGMMVRLGFAVAAHLEPEILIVDEVLAVGDAEFQKKALGKMKEVSSGEGRTVLFVSHNIQAISTLCDRALLVQNGKIIFQGETARVVNEYLFSKNKEGISLINRTDREGNGNVIVSDVIFWNKKNEIIDSLQVGKYLKIEIRLVEKQKIDFSKLIVACSFSDPYQRQVVSWISDEMPTPFHSAMKPSFFLEIPALNIRPGEYNFNLQISFNTTAPSDIADLILSAAKISIMDSDYFVRGMNLRKIHSAVLDASFIV